LAGVHHTDWSWCVLFGDLDNSGWKDVMVTNGFRRDMQDLDFVNALFRSYPFGTPESWEERLLRKVEELPGIYEPNYLYRNKGDLTFENMSREWGFQHPSYSGGAVLADLDGDGDLDVVINNLGDHPFVYRNNLLEPGAPVPAGHNFLTLTLDEDYGGFQTLGSKFTLRSAGQEQYIELFPVRGYLSCMDRKVHFGLGADTLVTELRIEFPDGSCAVLHDLKANQHLHLPPPGEVCPEREPAPVRKPLFAEDNERLIPGFRHVENDYNDFLFQPLLPHKHSQNGPGMAVGDIDGDGLEDFYIGGARGQNGAFYLQTGDGRFLARPLQGTENFEDMGALLFDADGDGHADLYVVSGSVEAGRQSADYRDRLYLNDGKGRFSRVEAALPDIAASGSCVTACDVDRDGDLDLFVGGRVSPRNYPLAPRSYLLINESEPGNPRFVDATGQWSPSLAEAGMVSAALWTDFDGDGLHDLIVTGEWMPVRFFRNTGASLEEVTGQTGLDHTAGWWNSLAGADFDRDGDMDYLLGNLGLNSELKASPEKPVSLYAKDFDNDGNVDPILFRYIHDENVPSHSRDMLVTQISSWQNRFPTYKDYAGINLGNLFMPGELENADVHRAGAIPECPA
jgi:enediyne biosynthesis protein E4